MLSYRGWLVKNLRQQPTKPPASLLERFPFGSRVCDAVQTGQVAMRPDRSGPYIHKEFALTKFKEQVGEWSLEGAGAPSLIGIADERWCPYEFRPPKRLLVTAFVTSNRVHNLVG